MVAVSNAQQVGAAAVQACRVAAVTRQAVTWLLSAEGSNCYQVGHKCSQHPNGHTHRLSVGGPICGRTEQPASCVAFLICVHPVKELGRLHHWLKDCVAAAAGAAVWQAGLGYLSCTGTNEQATGSGQSLSVSC